MTDAVTPAAAAPAAPAAATTLITTPPAAAPAAPASDAPPAPAAAAPAAGAPPEGGEGKTPEQIEADRVAAEEAAKPAGAPEKYEPFTPPEGGNLDGAVMDQFAEAARDLNLPQDKAQQLINKMAPAIAARQAEQLETMRTEWAAQSTTDKEFGGDKLPESLAAAKSAIDKFGSPELTKLLNDTGLGNHPDMIRFMVKTGKAMSEDRVVTGGVPGATRTAADVLYGASALKK